MALAETYIMVRPYHRGHYVRTLNQLTWLPVFGQTWNQVWHTVLW